jgi:hypothetical protein
MSERRSARVKSGRRGRTTAAEAVVDTAAEQTIRGWPGINDMHLVSHTTDEPHRGVQMRSIFDGVIRRSYECDSHKATQDHPWR